MASPWKYLPLDLPNDQAVVWVRRLSPLSPPFLAMWDLTSQTFIDDANSVLYPAYSISRWKAQ